MLSLWCSKLPQPRVHLVIIWKYMRQNSSDFILLGVHTYIPP